MNPRPTCDEVQLLAPEVALGIASGDERALVLEHAKSCDDCRRVMDELSVTADALLLLGPRHEPSSGFESTVLAKIQAARRPSPRLRPKLAAAVLASVVVTGAAAFWITKDDRELASHYRHALAEANGEYFGVVPLQAPNGDRAGHLFAYEGDTPWIFLIFATSLEPGRYEAEIETREGATRSIGLIEMTAGDVTWGRDLPVGLREVRAVRILDERGAVALEASFPAP